MIAKSWQKQQQEVKELLKSKQIPNICGSENNYATLALKKTCENNKIL